jgi:hypothetical protein
MERFARAGGAFWVLTRFLGIYVTRVDRARSSCGSGVCMMVLDSMGVRRRGGRSGKGLERRKRRVKRTYGVGRASGAAESKTE